jgi:branched-chain amino acid transport system substrate-binding protein
MVLKGRKLLGVLVLMLFMLSIVSGCSSSKKEAAPDKTTAPENILVGINVELSGAVASYGTNCRDGALLAMEQINSRAVFSANN